MRFLRQSTDTVIETPPLIDDTDGKTPEDALTVASIDVQLMQPLDSAVVPPDRATNGAFTTDTGWTKGTGWDINSTTAGKAHHATGTASDLEQTPALALVEGAAYELVFTISGFSAGTVTPKIGGVPGTARSSDATFTETIVAGSGTLIEFTADSTFVGDLDDVVYKQVPVPITPAASGSSNDMVLIRANTGAYWLELTAAQLIIVGRHRIQYFISGVLIAWEDFMVIEEAVFDAMYASGAVAPAIASTMDTLLDALVLNVTTIATLASQVSFTLTDGSADNDAYNEATIVVVDSTTGTQKAFGSLADYIGASKTIALAQDPGIFTMAVGDIVYILPSDSFAILDAELTGVKHNVTNSLGRRTRQQQEAGTYALGLVWLDTVAGFVGTTLFENGTEVRPVKTIAEANTILAEATLGLHGCHVAAGSSISFPGAQDNQEWTGEGWTLALNSKSIDGTSIIDAVVSGISSGVPNALRECFINGSTFAGGDFVNCALGGVITLSGATNYHFFNCHHARAAALSEIDFDAAIGAQEVHIHHWHGNLIVKNMKAGDVLHFTCADGALTLDSTCTAGTANLAGTFTLTDNSSGMTINDIGRGTLLTIASEARLAELDSGNLPADIAALNDLSAAEVNAEVLDVMDVDVVTLPGQEAPPLTPTRTEMAAWEYKVFRNRKDQSGSLWQLYGDDESTVDSKATVSDTSGVATKQEIVSGP